MVQYDRSFDPKINVDHFILFSWFIEFSLSMGCLQFIDTIS